MSRHDVEFLSAGQRCRAWLYLPEADAPRPVIVMAHGLGAVRELRLEAFAERFQAAGYAALVFDYRHFGASEGEPRQVLDIGRQREDWAAALAWARACPLVDGERVVLWGTSFSGGHVLSVGADDGRVAAVISQCPFTDGLASALTIPPLTSLRLSALAVRDRLGALLGRPPILVKGAGQPGEMALMTAPDCVRGYLGLVPEGFAFRNEVAARFVLDIIRDYPGRRAAELTMPVLFCICDTDTVAPARAALRHAARARRGEIRRYPEGHFDIYVGAAFERVVADQIDFLTRQVPVT